MQVALFLAIGAGKGEGWGSRSAWALGDTRTAGREGERREWRTGGSRTARSTGASSRERKWSPGWHARKAGEATSRLGTVRVVVAGTEDSVKDIAERGGCFFVRQRRIPCKEDNIPATAEPASARTRADFMMISRMIELVRE